MVKGELQQRIASSAVLLLIAAAGIWYGGQFAAMVLTALGLLGVYEWLDMIRPRRLEPLQGASYLAIIATMLAGYWLPPDIAVAVLLLAGTGVFAAALRLERAGPEAPNQPVMRERHDVRRACWVAAGVFYLGGGCLALMLLRSAELGLILTLYLMLTVWGTDSGAYLFGRWLKGPKLLPAVSPTKTWAGFFGGIATSAALGYVYAGTVGVPGMSWQGAIVLALVAQAGDLFESMVKRRFGVKDSGQLIPGHGGMLDRIDSLMFAAIFAAAVLALFGWRFGE